MVMCITVIGVGVVNMGDRNNPFILSRLTAAVVCFGFYSSIHQVNSHPIDCRLAPGHSTLHREFALGALLRHPIQMRIEQVDRRSGPVLARPGRPLRCYAIDNDK